MDTIKCYVALVMINRLCFRWPNLMLRLAKDLAVDMDHLRRHHVCELYRAGQDKLAEEVGADKSSIQTHLYLLFSLPPASFSFFSIVSYFSCSTPYFPPSLLSFTNITS